MHVSSISSSGSGSTKTSRSVGAGSTSGRRGISSSSMWTTATRILSRRGLGDSARFGDSRFREGERERLGEAERFGLSRPLPSCSSPSFCLDPPSCFSCFSGCSPARASPALASSRAGMGPPPPPPPAGLRSRDSRVASPCENLQRLPRLQRPRLKSLHISTSRAGLLRPSAVSHVTSSAFCRPSSVSSAMASGLPATFWPRSSRAASLAEAASRNRTRAAPRDEESSLSVSSMSMPRSVLGFTAPWRSAETSEEVQRPGKSRIRIAPLSGGGDVFGASSAGGSQSSMEKTFPSARLCTALLATSVSTKAATARMPWSSIMGCSESTPKASSSVEICAASFSEGMASHSRGKSVMLTYWPRTMPPSRLPRRVLGQSRIRCPRMPQMWHSRSSLPTGSRPSGCV
mmetsp:Transcript_148255/g.412912  ORF Transcript_148255/g.412912 Transcript_148255/m.412912 type:complete len:403 (+) Transcript_148255:620-1828(+)